MDLDPQSKISISGKLFKINHIHPTYKKKLPHKKVKRTRDMDPLWYMTVYLRKIPEMDQNLWPKLFLMYTIKIIETNSFKIMGLPRIRQQKWGRWLRQVLNSSTKDMHQLHLHMKIIIVRVHQKQIIMECKPLIIPIKRARIETSSLIWLWKIVDELVKAIINQLCKIESFKTSLLTLISAICSYTLHSKQKDKRNKKLTLTLKIQVSAFTLDIKTAPFHLKTNSGINKLNQSVWMTQLLALASNKPKNKNE